MKLTIRLNTPFVYGIRGKMIKPISEDGTGWYFRLKVGLYVVFYENLQNLKYDLRNFRWLIGDDDIVYDEILKMYVVKIEINPYGIFVHKMRNLIDFMRKIDESVDEGVAKQQE